MCVLLFAFPFPYRALIDPYPPFSRLPPPPPHPFFCACRSSWSCWDLAHCAAVCERAECAVRAVWAVCTPRLPETPPHRPAVHTHWAYVFIYFGIGRRLRELEWTELSTINLRLQDAGCSRLQECNRQVWFCFFAKQQVTSNNVLELRVGSCTDGQLQTQTIDLQSW